jgi:hypothetical protein
MNDNKRKKFLIGGSLAGLVVCGAIYWLTRPPTPEAVAEAFLRSAFGENPNWSLNYVFEHELKINGLKKDQVSRLVLDGLHPMTAGFKLKSIDFEYYNDSQVIALAKVEKEGKEYPVDCIVQIIDGRPTIGLGMLVPKIWTVQYLSEKKTGLTELNYFLAVTNGVAKDAPRLESLGLKGSTATMTPDGSVPKIFTWKAMNDYGLSQISALTK